MPTFSRISLDFIEDFQVDGICNLERCRQGVWDLVSAASGILRAAHLNLDRVAVAERPCRIALENLMLNRPRRALS